MSTKPGRHQPVAGVDLLAAAALDVADLDDAAVADRDVGGYGRAAAAVGQQAAADDEIVDAHRGLRVAAGPP